MSTCLDIVRRALRLVAGETGVPEGQEGQDALERLQSIFLDQPGFLHNGTWRDRYKDAAYTACESDRITVTAPGVVTLPTVITDDYSLCQRQPLDLAKVQIIGADATNAGFWIYSASKAAWGKLDGLALSDECPFGTEDDEGLAAQLAVALVDEYGGEVSARTVAKANQSQAGFRARFKKHRRCDPVFRDYV